MSTKKNEIIRLISSCTKHFYTIKRNKKSKYKKIELKKFDPIIRKHVIYKENKK